MKSRRPIVITGFMGCGKTEVARCLAEQLRIEMADLDEVITQTEGRSPARLICEEGERAFRTIETGALANLLDKEAVGVVALGGGAWIESANRNLIAQAGAISVWLDAAFDTCWERIEVSSEDRPLGRTLEQASELYELRRPVYELADIRLEARAEDGPDDLAARLQTAVGSFEATSRFTSNPEMI